MSSSGAGPADNNFDLEIFVTGEECHLVARSPFVDKEFHEDIKIPPASAWSERLALLQATLLSNSPWTSRVRDARGAPAVPAIQGASKALPPKIIREIGEDLFNLLFVRNIYSAYSASKDQRQPVNYRFCFNSPELSYLPWETLYNGSEFISLSPRTPLIRSARLDDDDGLGQDELPLCVLGMIPRVRRFDDVELAPLNVEAEQDNIKAALRDLEDGGHAILQWAAGSVGDLTRRLNHPPEGQPTWHIFHFCGHGGFDQREGAGGFIFVDPDRSPLGLLPNAQPQARPLYADDLKHVLENSPGLRLVILNSCRGGAGSAGASGTAEALVKSGFSAVVAMQFEITDTAALWFCSSLYSQLADGPPLHKAVTIARQTLKTEGSSEWITPVLYMRSRDGRLFKIVSSG